MARFTRSKLALPVLGLILLLGMAASIWQPWRRIGGKHRRGGNHTQAELAQGPDDVQGGVQARDADSAKRTRDGGWFVDDGNQHASLVDRSVDVSMLAIRNPDDPQLLEVDMWAMGAREDFKLMKEAYQCELQHLTALEKVCSFRLRMVLQRKEGMSGKVTYVKSTSEEPMDEHCQAYSDCMANSVFLGEAAPMPSGNEEAVAIHMDHRMLPFKGKGGGGGGGGDYKAAIAAQMADLRFEYRQMQENPDTDPRSLERMEALLKFMEIRSAGPS